MHDLQWIKDLKSRAHSASMVDNLDKFYIVIGYLLDRTLESDLVTISSAPNQAFTFFSIETDYNTSSLVLKENMEKIEMQQFDTFRIEFDSMMLRLLNRKDTAKEAMTLLLGQESISKINLFLHSYDPLKDIIRYKVILNKRLFLDPSNIQII